MQAPLLIKPATFLFGGVRLFLQSLFPSMYGGQFADQQKGRGAAQQGCVLCSLYSTPPNSQLLLSVYVNGPIYFQQYLMFRPVKKI